MIKIDEYGNKITVNAIKIPPNATNGDIIKALFPNMEIEFINQTLIYPNGLYKAELKVKPYNADEDNLVFVLRSLADWWNAPYKAESEQNFLNADKSGLEFSDTPTIIEAEKEND